MHGIGLHEKVSSTTECAMHMVDGLMHERADEILQAWRQGCCELFIELGQYASLCEQLYQDGFSKYGGEFPGVFNYEVPAEFGGWFGNYLIEFGKEPPREVAEDTLCHLADQFWQQLEGQP